MKYTADGTFSYKALPKIIVCLFKKKTKHNIKLHTILPPWFSKLGEDNSKQLERLNASEQSEK